MKKQILLIGLISILLAGCNTKTANFNNGFELAQNTSNSISVKLSDDSVSFDYDINLYAPIGDSVFAKNVNDDLASFLFNSDETLSDAWKLYVDFLSLSFFEEVKMIQKNDISKNESPMFKGDYVLKTNASNSGNGIFNYYVNIYNYVGGAHGATLYTCRNYDAKDGHLISLSDIINKDDAALKKVLYDNLLMKIGASDSSQMSDLGYFVTSVIPVPENYAIKKDTLSFIYNQYEIAPYSTGVTVLDIPMSDLKAVLK